MAKITKQELLSGKYDGQVLYYAEYYDPYAPDGEGPIVNILPVAVQVAPSALPVPRLLLRLRKDGSFSSRGKLRAHDGEHLFLTLEEAKEHYIESILKHRKICDQWLKKHNELYNKFQKKLDSLYNKAVKSQGTL